MAKKTTPPSEPKKPSLLVARTEAEAQIKKQIGKLAGLLAGNTNLEQAETALDQLAKYNEELLGRIFNNDVIAREYRHAMMEGYSIRRTKSVSSWVDRRLMVSRTEALKSGAGIFQREVQVHITALESILQRLELIPELPKISIAEDNSIPKTELGSDIFIVHGHDEAAKESVARFIEKLELKPIILHEQPDKGRTIIEKFEEHSNVGFAIVLLTPDDVGAPIKQQEKLKSRARQNVIFELGFFVGRLGRNRVCALYKGDIEMPSDYKGVLYKPMMGDWQLSLAKEIKAAGISIDLNRAI